MKQGMSKTDMELFIITMIAFAVTERAAKKVEELVVAGAWMSFGAGLCAVALPVVATVLAKEKFVRTLETLDFLISGGSDF